MANIKSLIDIQNISFRATLSLIPLAQYMYIIIDDPMIDKEQATIIRIDVVSIDIQKKKKITEEIIVYLLFISQNIFNLQS